MVEYSQGTRGLLTTGCILLASSCITRVTEKKEAGKSCFHVPGGNEGHRADDGTYATTWVALATGGMHENCEGDAKFKRLARCSEALVLRMNNDGLRHAGTGEF